MQVQNARTSADFAKNALAFLLADETANGMLISSVVASAVLPPLKEREIAFTVTSGHAAQLAGLRRAGRGLVLSSGSIAASAAAACHLARDSHRLDLVSGPTAIVRSFARAWQRQPGSPFGTVKAFHLLALTEIDMPPAIEGRMRVATTADADLLSDWLVAFTQEALQHEIKTPPEARQMIDAGLATRRIYVWDRSGELLGMAAWSRPTPNGITINGVYTPPAARGRGVAGNLVASLSAQLLATGKTFCCLYTDQENAISNRVYKRIGYVWRGDSELLRVA